MLGRRKSRSPGGQGTGADPSEWIVSFDRLLSDEAIGALAAAGLRSSDEGPPTGVPAISVEARGPTHAELIVGEALEGIDPMPFMRSHPPPRWIAKEAEAQYWDYLGTFSGLSEFEPGSEILRWAMMAYGVPPEDLTGEADVMYWALMGCHGVTPAYGVDEAIARHRLVAPQETEEFVSRWPPKGVQFDRSRRARAA